MKVFVLLLAVSAVAMALPAWTGTTSNYQTTALSSTTSYVHSSSSGNPCGNQISGTFIDYGQAYTGNTDYYYSSLPYSLDPCGSSSADVGEWFLFFGRGEIVTISTNEADTDFDTYLKVYDCDTIDSCVAYDDDCNGLSAVVSFYADYGKVYYIFVTGFAGQQGQYEIAAYRDDQGCATSISYYSSTTALGTTFSTTWSAAKDEAVKKIDTKDTTTKDDGSISNFVVNMLTKAKQSLSKTTKSAWRAAAGAAARNAAWTGSSSTTSSISWSSSSSSSGNPCGNFINGPFISTGQAVSGNTGSSSSSAPSDLDSCGSSLADVGDWYLFYGLGEVVTLSTNEPGTSFDTYLKVYDCDTTDSCVTYDDDCGGLSAVVSFFADYGKVYYVFVTGFAGQTGDYELAAYRDDQGCASSISYYTTTSSSTTWSAQK